MDRFLKECKKYNLFNKYNGYSFREIEEVDKINISEIFNTYLRDKDKGKIFEFHVDLNTSTNVQGRLLEYSSFTDYIANIKKCVKNKDYSDCIIPMYGGIGSTLPKYYSVQKVLEDSENKFIFDIKNEFNKQFTRVYLLKL